MTPWPRGVMEEVPDSESVKSAPHNIPVVLPSLSGPELFARVSEEGREEMRRPLGSLWWSAVAAGLVISLSTMCMASLHAVLPKEPWRILITSLGYCVGFVVVVLGRLQLFTENTITTVLPLLQDRTKDALTGTARLWAVVFVGNLAGCITSAVLIYSLHVTPHATLGAALELSRHYFFDRSLGQMFSNALPAGFIVAAMVWSSPASGSARFWVVVLLSYMIAAGGLAYVIAGSTELSLLVLAGEASILDVALRGVLPAAGGNILGGTLFFALLAYGQARGEIDDGDPG